MPPLSLDIFADPLALARLKEYVSGLVDLSHDALHIHIGLLIWLLLFLILGRKRWSGWAAWGIILAIAIWVEWMDFRLLSQPYIIRNVERAQDAGLHDIINTMIWPSLFVLFGPWLFRKAGKAPGSGEGGDQSLE